MARKACAMGATTADLAELFSVAPATVDKWIAEIPLFSETVKKAKHDRDVLVEKSLFDRATGYSHPEDKIFNDQGVPLIVPTIKHYPPDPVSMIFWLKNRQPAKWRDKQEHDHVHTGEITSVKRIIIDPEREK